jgi:hypothetical protein
MRYRAIILEITFVLVICGLALLPSLLLKLSFPDGPPMRGSVYESWEASNNYFKGKIIAYHETGVFLPGAYFACQAAPVVSGDRTEFASFRVDDPITIPRDRLRFVSDRVGYIFMSDKYVVTIDGGNTWHTWRPMTAAQNGESVGWGIQEVNINSDGTGRAKLIRYDPEDKAMVELQMGTRDYGQGWSAQ